jgi:hypothetical protein
MVVMELHIHFKEAKMQPHYPVRLQVPKQHPEDK